MSILVEMQDIITSIVRHVITSETPAFGSWRIGLSNDAPAIYEEWNRPACFASWEIGDARAAKAIETFFMYEKGMKGGISGELDDAAAITVCIFPLS